MKLALTTLAVSAFILAAETQAVEIAAPYVPTAPSVVERMLEVAKVQASDYVIDLGSGDGRIVIAAARKYGARGLGIEIDPQLVAQANANARAAGVSDRASFIEADLFAADISKATVVTIYLLTRATIKLRSRLFDLRPGTRIVSNATSMGEWKPDHFEMIDVKDKVRGDAPARTYVQLWIVPAKVAGVWRWSFTANGRSHDHELTVSQEFQKLSGSLRAGGRAVALQRIDLEGDRIRLVFTDDSEGALVEHRLAGRVGGDVITGAITVGSGEGERKFAWHATRLSPLSAGAPR